MAIQDLLSPSLCRHANRHQPIVERERGREREERVRRLTRFRGLWSIKGLHRNSKTTPTISTNEVSASVAVGCKCVWVMCMSVLPWMCVQWCWRACREFYASPVAASEQEPQDLASSLVLFFS